VDAPLELDDLLGVAMEQTTREEGEGGRVAVYCSVLQCVAVCCRLRERKVRAEELQCVAMCCSVSQCVAVCCRLRERKVKAEELQCVAMCCSVCCSVLQCVADYARGR